MRLKLALLAAVALGVIRPALGERAFPYKAYIAADDTYVRSGPGENHYPTSKLKAGTQVEVYRHDPGGWYAIRPPEGSFSWIGKQFLGPIQDGLAEVKGKRVAVRVGTELSERMDVVQVRLKRGEVVEVLSKPPTSGTGSADWWCKISPPSGEFRWVQGNEVDLTPPQAGGGKAKPAPALNAAATGTPSTDTRLVDRSTASKWTSAATNTATPASGSAASVEGAAAASASTKETRHAGAGSSIRPRNSEEFQKELDDINTELSLVLAQDPAAWNCQDLSRRAQVLFDQAQTAVERGHARMLVHRIALCEDLQRRSADMSTATIAVNRRTEIPVERPSAAGLRGSVVGNDGRFDGVGRLARVQQSRLGAPRYALLDNQGNVQMYVTPAPGVAMQGYVGREVGISGVRAFVAEQNADLLTAKHVTALDTRLR